MIEYNSSVPVQTISYQEKIAKDYEWAKATMRSYVDRSYFVNSRYKLGIKKLYDYYNGHINKEDYTLITSPFGKKIEGDWSNVVNYPILKTKVDLLLEEFMKRPKTRQVYAVNDDVINIQQEDLRETIYQNLEQLFINQLNNQGFDTGIPTEEIQVPENIKKEHEVSYKDQRAILGQNALEFIDQYCRLDEQFHLAFFHWLVSGEVYSYKGVSHNEVFYETVNPLDIDYDKDPDLIFIEDGDWIIRRKYMNPSSIVAEFYDDFPGGEKDKRDMINKIETLGVNGPIFYSSAEFLRDRNTNPTVYSKLVEVKHVCWRSKKKVGICDYVDEMGQSQKMEVDETFKPMAELNQSVEWLWVNELWEGYMIGQDVFLRLRPIPIQRTDLDNISKCKFPYNGRTLSNINSQNISLISLGVPYQILYNATMHRLKLAMAKMKDDMGVIDVNWKPKNMSLDEWILYGDTTGILFVDYNKEGRGVNNQHQNVMKFASTTIASYVELLRFIKEEWDEVCGITRQREGQISTSETVGGVERSVVQSSLITGIYHTKFDQFRKREYEGLLDYSKFAWIEGKKTSFVQPDVAKTIYLDVYGPDYCECEFGIFVADSGKEADKFKKAEAQYLNMLQNGAKGSTIIDALDSENFAEIKRKVREAEDQMDQYNQQMEMMKGEQQKEIVAMQDAQLEKAHGFKLEEIDRKGEWDLRKAEVTAIGIDDEGGATDIILDEANFKQQELNIKRGELAQKERDSVRKSETEKYKADKQVQVAKLKPKPSPTKKK